MRCLIRLVALSLLWPLSQSSLALVQVPLSVRDLSGKAELIVRGTVSGKSCQRDGEGRIYTRVELQVTEVWKGTLATNPLWIVHGGGSLGGERVVVSGQVEYQVGEEVVAFLVRNARGEAVTLGLAQGKFRVWRDGNSGQWLVSNPFHGVAQVSGGSAASTAADRARLTLSALKDQVKGELK